MKRFVTYLYEYERGNKLKNVGFIRVNVRGRETSMEVYIRNILHGNGLGNISVLIYKDELHGIELGELRLMNGQSDSRFSFATEDIMGSRFSINDIVGVGIRLESGGYIASCWKDAYAEEIARGEFAVRSESVKEELNLEEVEIASVENKRESEDVVCANNMQAPLFDDEREFDVRNHTTYEKIDLSQIRDLPSPNWHFATNSFLVHGFWNYGYLVLKKEMEEGQKRLALGIPGIFEKPEAVMAVLFGFPSFEEIPKEMEKIEMNTPKDFSEKEKNQEPKTGVFGCWFVDLKV